MLRRLIITIVVIIISIIIYHPGRHAKHYDYVQDTDVLSELITQKQEFVNTNLKTCNYEEIINNNIEIEVEDIYKPQKYAIPQKDGEFIPKNCAPLFRTAILIPYRNRKEQLDLFLNYMHNYLQKQSIIYTIFIIEQNDTKPFNRAKMLNYGAAEAFKRNYDCIILHDVDILPLSTGNIYACAKKPRHMCSSLDSFRYNLPYLGLFGGVISIASNQYKHINGMSNIYDGWGGEDDDLFTRLEYYNFLPIRFSPEMSRYTMLMHKKEKPNEDRFFRLRGTMDRQKADGLNSLRQNYSIKLETLYAHIYVH